MLNILFGGYAINKNIYDFQSFNKKYVLISHLDVFNVL